MNRHLRALVALLLATTTLSMVGAAVAQDAATDGSGQGEGEGEGKAEAQREVEPALTASFETYAAALQEARAALAYRDSVLAEGASPPAAPATRGPFGGGFGGGGAAAPPQWPSVAVELKGHVRAVAGVAFTADPDVIITGGDSVTYEQLGPGSMRTHDGGDNIIRVWNARDGSQTGTIAEGIGPGTCPVTLVQASPDGSRFAVVAGRKRMWYVTAWDAQTLQPVRSLPLPKGSGVAGVNFSGDGSRLFVTHHNGDVRAFDLASGNEVGFLDLDTEGPMDLTAAVVTPDGTRAVLGTAEGDVIIYDLANARGLEKSRAHNGQVGAIALRGYRLATAGRDGFVRLRDLSTGRDAGRLRHATALHSVVFVNDALLAVGERAGDIAVWDVRTAGRVGLLEGHDDVVTSLAASPDGRLLLSGSSDGTARTWVMPR